VVAIGGIFFSDVEIQQALIQKIGELIDAEAARLVEIIIDNVKNEERNVFSLIVGGTLMLIGATTAFAHLQDVLNQIWGVTRHGRRGIMQVFKGRLLSFAFLIVIGMLLVTSLLFSTLLATFEQFLSRVMTVAPSYWSNLDFAISYVVTTALIATIYKFLPDTHVPWIDAVFGAIVASLLFAGARLLVQAYIAQLSPGSSFGAAGSVVVFMFWIYCASLIILLGAELSRASANYRAARRTLLGEQ
jgi:membrane protein